MSFYYFFYIFHVFHELIFFNSLCKDVCKMLFVIISSSTFPCYSMVWFVDKLMQLTTLRKI